MGQGEIEEVDTDGDHLLARGGGAGHDLVVRRHLDGQARFGGQKAGSEKYR